MLFRYLQLHLSQPLARVVSKHRSRLHPDTLEALMCAQSWLWKEKEGNRFTYKFMNCFILKYLVKVFFLCAFFLLGDSSIHDSQLQLTMMDENDDLLVL